MFFELYKVDEMTSEPTFSFDALLDLFRAPLLDLIFQASSVHRQYHNPRTIQLNKLISVKTGGCPEDCGYCPQSARYKTGVKRHGLMSDEEVLQKAIAAKERGASRICLGAAWREVKNNRDFETVLRQVRSIAALGIEVCCTLGMLNHKAADDLKKAGLTAYNHNLDSSEQFYGEIVHTRTYQDRLNTIVLAKSAGLSICSGGIIGMGESIEDRANLLLRLQSIRPESVPINALVPVSGTPLGQRQRIDSFAIVQMIAAARVVLPHAMIRISAGRDILSDADHALCFLAGANSIFYDDQLLTAPNPSCDRDDALLAKLGLHRSRNLALRS